MKRFVAVIFWSMIAAAFIGPGTVTTCASAGAGFGFTLLWALTFSTIACLVLQEASARITVVSGRNLGEAIRERAGEGSAGLVVLGLALSAILLGCAAYEAGNLLGAVAGAQLVGGGTPAVWTLAFGTVATAVLALGSTAFITRVMSVLVALMGIGFLATAAMLAPDIGSVLAGAVVPALPPGSELLVLGLVGTTVVPYNIFLGSALAEGQSLATMRFGLTLAIVLGGVISMSIVVVGSAVAGPFSFEVLADVLASRLGAWATVLLALGLAAAGLSSAITAPLAAALTARSLLARSREDPRWLPGSRRYTAVWATVVATGVVLGAIGVRPVHAIILAQALNGVLLPVAAILLLLTVNDVGLVGREVSSPLHLAAMVVVTATTALLGTASAVRAVAAALALPPPGLLSLLLVTAIELVVTVPLLGRAVARRRTETIRQPSL